jgi:signal transduction histidine kinase
MTDQALPVLGDVVTDDETSTRTGTAGAASGTTDDPVGSRSAGAPRFVFSTAARRGTVAYVAITVPLVTIVFWSTREPHAYLESLLAASLLYVWPGCILAVVAALRSPPADRTVRWMWVAVFLVGIVAAGLGRTRIEPGMDPPIARTAVPVLFTLVLLGIANTRVMRARSGQRAALVDGVDLVMATIALVAPIGLAFGSQIIGSPVPWFTTSTALWFVVACHGTLVAVVIRSRLQPGHQAMANAGIAFGVIVMVSTAAHLVLGTSDFALPAGPFVGIYALSFGIGMIFFAFSTREASPGLERLPPGAQVRRNSLIAILVLVSIPVIASIVWWRHDESWVLGVGLGAVLTLLGLSSMRHLLAARETIRLYQLVEQSAQQRGELLSEVMAHVDTDRHRAAAHLHRQAASLYAAMAAFTSAIDQAVEAGNPASVSFAAERLRRDLGQRADGLRRLAEAVKPLAPSDQGARRLAAPMRAYLENVCGDGPRPDLTIDVDPDLALDWTTEAAVLRIVQEATLNAWWYAGATVVSVSVAAEGRHVAVEVVDDGCGETPPNVVVSSMQSVARFLGGDLTIDRSGAGCRVSATIPVAMPVPDEHRPHLRLVDDRLP